MNRMFESVSLFVLSCLSLTVQSQIGEILPPQNLTLKWLSDFRPELTWQPPQPSMTSCQYIVCTKTTIETRNTEQTSPWTTFIVMQGGFLRLSVQTECSGNVSELAVINVTYPVLVENLNCYIYSREDAHCSWQPATHVPDLGFFYQSVTQGPEANDSDSLTLQECSSYNFTKGVKTGCNLRATCNQEIFILFNGTQSNGVIRNTFTKKLTKTPPPPMWTVREIEGKFNISWTPPDICASDQNQWDFIINYTECDHSKKLTTGETSLQLSRKLHCPYCMTIKADRGDGETPWSEKKCFEPRTDYDVLVYAAIMIPLTFGCLAALAFVYCRKNKEKIFPKVPQPRDLLSDISDNNNKSTVCNLYIPAKEEENCKITLVADPLINRPDC